VVFNLGLGLRPGLIGRFGLFGLSGFPSSVPFFFDLNLSVNLLHHPFCSPFLSPPFLMSLVFFGFFLLSFSGLSRKSRDSRVSVLFLLSGNPSPLPENDLNWLSSVSSSNLTLLFQVGLLQVWLYHCGTVVGLLQVWL